MEIVQVLKTTHVVLSLMKEMIVGRKIQKEVSLQGKLLKQTQVNLFILHGQEEMLTL